LFVCTLLMFASPKFTMFLGFVPTKTVFSCHVLTRLNEIEGEKSVLEKKRDV